MKENKLCVKTLLPLSLNKTDWLAILVLKNTVSVYKAKIKHFHIK